MEGLIKNIRKYEVLLHWVNFYSTSNEYLAIHHDSPLPRFCVNDKLWHYLPTCKYATPKVVNTVVLNTLSNVSEEIPKIQECHEKL